MNPHQIPWNAFVFLHHRLVTSPSWRLSLAHADLPPQESTKGQLGIDRGLRFHEDLERGLGDLVRPERPRLEIHCIFFWSFLLGRCAKNHMMIMMVVYWVIWCGFLRKCVFAMLRCCLLHGCFSWFSHATSKKTLKEWGGTHSKTTLSEGWNHGCSMAPMQRCSWGLQRMVLALKKWGLVLQQSTSTIDPFFDIFLVI